ncbi:MAG: FAD-dependent oxidoreductase [Deltaproteobacteria bacterium]|nr:FAD-dependent oxidoreductase [Deltaproteobacteria bacterium]MBM4322737.1 FAD-dependent oxidoreductase [Deltaproteobacteria bacterium]
MKVVIAGGGWSGCAASLSARKQGAEVLLIERTDMLLGTGLVGGIMRNNGRFTATEEMIAMGGSELFRLIDRNALHQNIQFPGHLHTSLYNVATMEPLVKNLLLERGTSILLSTRMEEVEREGDRIKAITVRQGKEKFRIEGDAFIDATGTAGPPANCNKYGNGCAMCILRCPSFGGRISLAAKAGVTEMIGRKGEQIGAMSGSCKLFKESLSREIVDRLEKEGVAIIPVPSLGQSKGKLSIKACQQYALPEFEENLILLDTGHAKLMVPFFPLEGLRRIPGFENARYEDPYAGGLGNSIRYVGMAPRNDALKVSEVENLFCGGEKAGLLVGHTEAIATGTLAGFNAVRQIRKEKPLIIPDTLAVGDAIAYVRTQMETEKGLGYKYTFSGSVYFDRMKQKGLYSIDPKEIEKRVDQAGLSGVFSE